MKQAEASPVSPGRAAVLRRLRERTAEFVDETVRRMWRDIPSYPAVRDPAFRADVAEHVRAHHGTVLGVLEAGAPVTREDLLFVRRHTADRVGRGIPIADYLSAHRIYQDVVWDGLLEAADDPDHAHSVLALVGTLLDYINVATTHAAELYIEIEEVDLAGGERIRRDLLEDLVAARPVAPGPRQDAARDAGLGPEVPCLAVVAVPRAMPDDEHVLRAAAGAVRRACGTGLTALTVLRRDEIVVVTPIRGSDCDEVVTNLTAAAARLASQNVRLAVGVSTVHSGLAGVASAHREARGAADCLGADGGVLALPALSAFDYLSSFRDPTAERLICPAIRQFVEEDIARGGVLTSTLVAYVASDLNIKALSERIYVHPNTAHYRLGRIAEQTGRDPRKMSHALELLIAIRQAQPLGDRPFAAWA
jgi:sugar diacid utilization regulator